MVDGAVVRRLVAGDGRVPGASARNTHRVNAISVALVFYERLRVRIGKSLLLSYAIVQRNVSTRAKSGRLVLAPERHFLLARFVRNLTSSGLEN